MGGSSTRTVKPNLVVIHTGEGILNRNDMASFLDRTAGISAHAASDSGGVAAPLVSYDRAAWTAGPTGNNRGIHIEMCAFAVMTRAQWLSKNDVVVWVPDLGENRTIKSPYTMVQNTANWARSVANQYGIPLRKLSASEVRSGQAGICGHAEITLAWGESNHTDPGQNFPWDVFIEIVKGEEDLDAQQNAFLTEIWQATSQGVNKPELSILQRHVNFLGDLFISKVDQLSSKLDELSDKVDSIELGGISEEEIADIAVNAVEKKLES